MKSCLSRAEVGARKQDCYLVTSVGEKGTSCQEYHYSKLLGFLSLFPQIEILSTIFRVIFLSRRS